MSIANRVLRFAETLWQRIGCPRGPSAWVTGEMACDITDTITLYWGVISRPCPWFPSAEDALGFEEVDEVGAAGLGEEVRVQADAPSALQVLGLIVDH